MQRVRICVNRKDGILFSAISICDDQESEIINHLSLLSQQAELIIVSGGLGPTTDDLTREAIARFCGVGIFQDDASLLSIKELFEKRKRTFNPTNVKQATFPAGASIIKNPIGTAPGFSIETIHQGRRVFLLALPGVPKEFYAMFNESAKPLLLSKIGILAAPAKQIIRLFGLPESEIGGRIEALAIDPSLTISYRAHFPEIQVKLSGHHATDLVEREMRRIELSLGIDYIFSRNLDERFEECALAQLKNNGISLSCAESCTGGALSSMITNLPGASTFFLGSVISYSNEAKQKFLDVDQQLLEHYGAVSEQVAVQMAETARKKFVSDIAISITGIAGPGGGTEVKPVGTYFIALATSACTRVFKLFFLSTRENFKRYVAYVALDILRRYSQDLPLSPYEQSPL